ncbi:alpha/beta hydrolase [Aurantiacibacter sp. D1-12]|uniref:alpha/beta hydrolase n=1 Tax=Aurantiacibacter sp. D1-12 TaxID=2993658 RepID=UPI00237CD64A|nr:alpha/beta hydrolase [Aurantiacibacter sp. D1-12]MDE1466602.1 alpha/beta hydrolase [Aurantiacibacter sp. D1-12]
MSLPRVLLNPLRLPRKGPEIGRGRAVIVIPGLTTGDISTTLLRRTLKARGFVPEGWRQGINLGADPEKMARLQARVAQLHAETGQKVVLVGWSLGGLYARVLANREAEHVDMVVTVASPIAGSRRGNSAWALYEAINDHKVDDTPFDADLACKPPVPTLSVWSAVDGIVAPECACGGESDSDHRLQIDAQHFTIGTSRDCIEKIIGKMAELDAERG